MSEKVLIVLLLFGLQLLSGQTVSKLQFENGTEVYQIIELQNNTVEFVNPLKKQPTLREIIFYKVIEKPYISKSDELEVVTKEKEKPKIPDFDETIRPFTNGHGLQFIKWGRHSQDENTEYTNAPEKEEGNVNKNPNSTNSDSIENHENDDKIIHNTNNYDKLNDDDKNNYKKSHIDKDEDDDDDDDTSNKKKSNIDKEDDDNNEDNKDANKKHSNDDGETEDDDILKDNDDRNGAKKAVDNTNGDDKFPEEKVKDEEVNTEEVYATHKRKKREFNYRNVPEAPKLPDLDVKAFPAYVQRMLASRPIFMNTQDRVKVRNNYNADLFHKMDGIFSNNKPKTYGFKYSNDRSESLNDVHKIQDKKENVNAHTFKDIPGSQRNYPYKKISELDIELSNTGGLDNFSDVEDKLTMIQNIVDKFRNRKPSKTYGMSINGPTVQTWNDISVNPTVTKYENANNENIVENKRNKVDNLNNARNRLNINFKDPHNYNNAHKENIAISKPYVEDKKFYAEEDIKTSSDNIDNQWGKFGEKPVTNVNNLLNENTSEIELEHKSNTVNKENIKTPQNYINFLNHYETNSDNYDEEIKLDENKTENKSYKSGEKIVENSLSPDEDMDNYDEEFDQTPESTSKVVNNILETPTEAPFDEVTYADEIDEPTDNYNEIKNRQYVSISSTERLPEKPKVTKEKLLIDNEDLKLKMKEFFINIIRQLPKLKEIELTGTKATDNFRNFVDGTNKKPVKPNTYGMHLEGEHGHTWNELTNPEKVTYAENSNKIDKTEPSMNHESKSTKIVKNKVENHTVPRKTTRNENNERTTKQPMITTEKQITVEKENKGDTEKPIENNLTDKKNKFNKDNVNEIFTNTQDRVKVRNNYNADLFHKMDGIFSNNKPKTYGFKYSNDRSESLNDIHKIQDKKENLNAHTFKGLSGSQTNGLNEKISEPDIELSNSDGLDNFPGVDIKDKSITTFQNIDNKFTNRKPSKTYGMSINGPKVQTWNDISGNPTVTKYENANKENLVENKPNKVDNLNNARNRLNLNFKEDPYNYDNAHKENIAISKPCVEDKKFYAEEDIKTSSDNIDNQWGKFGEKPVTNVDNLLNENTSEIELEHTPNTVNKENIKTPQNYINLLNHYETNSDNYDEEIKLDENKTENKSYKSGEKILENSLSPDEDMDNYDEEFDQTPESTSKVVNNILETPTEAPFDEVTNADEIDEPKDNYNEIKNSQYVLSSTERLTEKPKVTKEKLLIDNEDLKLKIKESFVNIIRQLPKLKEIELTGTKATDNFRNFVDGTNKKPVKPNTYGMHLEGEHGHTWNELTNPEKVTYVENSNKIDETEPSMNHESKTTKIVKSKVEHHTEPPRSTTKGKNEIRTKHSIMITTRKQNTVEEENKENTERPIENNQNDEKNNFNKENVNEDKDVDSNNKNETETLKISLDRLLKEDEFWKWLSNWTSTYMEVLNEQVETLLKSEVTNQLKLINDDKNTTKLNDCNKVDEGITTNNTIDDNVDKQSDEKKDNTIESSKIDESNTNNNTRSDNKAEEKSNTTALETEINNNITDIFTERNNSEAICKENELNKVNIKTDQDMNKGKNKSLPVNIKSGTIYGNAIGNDHVTNIFIFYPSVDSNKTLEKIEPIMNKMNSDISLEEKSANITIDERFGISEEKKDNNIEDSVGKTKDLIDGQNDTSSTLSTQKNKDATEKNMNSFKDTSTENSETASKTEEELKKITNGTDAEFINIHKSNKTTSELNETNDTTDLNTRQIDKTETTTGMSIKNYDETTPISNDVAAMSKTGKSDSTTDSNSVSNKSESTIETEKSDSATEKPESTSENSDSTTKPDRTKDSTTDKSDSKDTSDIVSTEKSADS